MALLYKEGFSPSLCSLGLDSRTESCTGHHNWRWELQVLNLRELFRCCRIHFNPCLLVWIRVEFSSSSTPIHLNTCGLMWIRQHLNKAWSGKQPQPTQRWNLWSDFAFWHLLGQTLSDVRTRSGLVFLILMNLILCTPMKLWFFLFNIMSIYLLNSHIIFHDELN